MSITDSINKNCVQTAVYWEFVSSSGYGAGKVFKAPIEIKCRWDDKQQLIPNAAPGTNLLSRAIVKVLQDLSEQGYLYLGTLEDINSAAYEDPTSENDAFIIKQFAKLPMLGSDTEFYRIAYLSEWQTM